MLPRALQAKWQVQNSQVKTRAESRDFTTAELKK